MSTTRRQFLGQAACGGVGLTSLLSALGTLRLLNAGLSAQTVPAAGDFKALVCLFLYGGNDGNNTIIPRDTAGYNAYAAARGALAIPSANLIPLSLPAGDSRQLGLHPALPRTASLFNSGQAAFVANVGTLVAPLTKAQYLAGGTAVPPYLFSHSDQTVQWMTSVPDSPDKIGWGGRLADLTVALNGNSQISMNISLAGTNYFQVGNQVVQYQLDYDGSVSLSNYTSTSNPRKQMYDGAKKVIGRSYGHLFEQEYVNVVGRAVANDTLIRSTLATIPEYTDKFPASVEANGLNRLAAQLRVVLRLIQAQAALGMRRQIYFVALGGFDTHGEQLADHAGLLSMLDNGLAEFHQGTVDIGMASNVTTFTASDFGRTLVGNGVGSDHAWGNHHLVLGGAVKGGRVYGTMPNLTIDGPSDTGERGSWIPTISTDEYSATLAKWFGVSPANMSLVLPNIGRFASPDLGFMS